MVFVPADRAALGPATPPRRTGRIVAVSNGRKYPVCELTGTGFVVEADGARPALRGTVDILNGAERIGRHLVQLVWVRDGLAGYEFKRRGLAVPVSPDCAPDPSPRP